MTEEKAVSERLSEIEKRLSSLGDDMEEASGAALTAQEACVRIERLIEYEIIHPIHKPVSLDEVRDKLDEVRDKLDEVRDKLDELLTRIG